MAAASARLPRVQPKPPSESIATISRWMGIGEANVAGNVHGGVILHMCDEVAGIAAVRHSGCRCVTAGMDRMTFRHPVYVGQLLTVKATVNAAWRTSMEVGVRVEAGAACVPVGLPRTPSTPRLDMTLSRAVRPPPAMKLGLVDVRTWRDLRPYCQQATRLQSGTAHP